MNIKKGNVTCLLNSGTEINIILYYIVLKLGLMMQPNIIIIIPAMKKGLKIVLSPRPYGIKNVGMQVIKTFSTSLWSRNLLH